jgi:hypothetical protein
MVIVKHYQPIIEALQGEEPAVTIRTKVTYQDGSSVERDVGLRIQSMGDADGAATRRATRSGRERGRGRHR